MRIYLEFFEVLEEGATEEPDFIRIDITGWRQEDVDTAIRLLRDHAQAYTHYIVQKHYCGHEDGEPCYTELLAQR
jgi:hypothetical protein